MPKSTDVNYDRKKYCENYDKIVWSSTRKKPEPEPNETPQPEVSPRKK
jgi:hypothetical protein